MGSSWPTLLPLRHDQGTLGVAGLRFAADHPRLAFEQRQVLGERHPILAARFFEGPDGPLQEVISPSVESNRTRAGHVDLLNLGRERAEVERQRIAIDLARVPFNLAVGPPQRLVVLRVAPRESSLVAVVHHIAADGAALAVLLSDLGTIYGAISGARPSGGIVSQRSAGLPLEKTTFADLAREERARLTVERLAGLIEQSQQTFAEVPRVLELPVDHPRPTNWSGRGRRQPFRLAPALAERLTEIARERGATPFQALLALEAAFLARLTSAQRFVIGTPVLNRDRPDSARLVGCLVNLLAVPIDASGDPAFDDLVRKTHGAAIGAMGRSELPFERLVEALVVERDLSRPALIQAVLSLTDFDLYALADTANVRFIGVDNYLRLLRDPLFWTALANTFVFALVGGALTLGLALAVALGLNSPLTRFAGWLRTAYFAPVVTTLVAVAVVWRYLYQPRYGLLNRGLTFFGLPEVDWLGDPRWALPALILLAVWKNFGYSTILFVAGLRSIPASLYEAAELDGAGAWARWRHITLPLLRPTIFFTATITLIGYLQFFAEPYVMTRGGGPVNRTLSVALLMFKQGFRWWNMGYASAVAFVLFAVVLAATLLQARWLKGDSA